MLNHYSIVIHPENHIIELFKSNKDTLFSKIGKFGSRNSIAHITILEFSATENELKTVIEKLIKIVQRERHFNAMFDKIVYSKTLFVSPDKDGNEHFKKLLENVRTSIKGKKNKSYAHLTIGRNLKPDQIENSIDLFSEIKFNFHCHQIALRRFNDNIGQYEIVQIFPFSGEHSKDEIVQMTLF